MGKLGKKIELRNRTIEKKDIENFVLVDLVIDGEVIETTNIPNGSYYFWEDMEEISQKAMKRLIDNNSERNDKITEVYNKKIEPITIFVLGIGWVLSVLASVVLNNYQYAYWAVISIFSILSVYLIIRILRWLWCD